MGALRGRNGGLKSICRIDPKVRMRNMTNQFPQHFSTQQIHNNNFARQVSDSRTSKHLHLQRLVVYPFTLSYLAYTRLKKRRPRPGMFLGMRRDAGGHNRVFLHFVSVIQYIVMGEYALAYIYIYIIIHIYYIRTPNHIYIYICKYKYIYIYTDIPKIIMNEYRNKRMKNH